jgi:hypothetical protein
MNGKFLCRRPKINNLHQLLQNVRHGPNDNHPVQKIYVQTVRRLDLRPLHCTDPPISGKHHKGRKGGFQSPVEVGEALDVKHVRLVNKEDTGDAAAPWSIYRLTTL